MVSRASWFRHTAADLLARKSQENADKNSALQDSDPLHVAAGDIDHALIVELEASGLFCEEEEQVFLDFVFLCGCRKKVKKLFFLGSSKKKRSALHGRHVHLAKCKIFSSFTNYFEDLEHIIKF